MAQNEPTLLEVFTAKIRDLEDVCALDERARRTAAKKIVTMTEELDEMAAILIPVAGPLTREAIERTIAFMVDLRALVRGQFAGKDGL